MKLSDFDYELPPELIAQHPPARREDSRMLAMARKTGICDLRTFSDIVGFLRGGDCLVVNDTKVIPGRIHATRPTGGRVEILLLEPLPNGAWNCLMKPGRRMRPGEAVTVDNSAAEARIQTRRDDGSFDIAFEGADAETVMTTSGSIPLPPYIQRPAESSDADRYQTVYARRSGAIAAPTAGLHFTPEILAALEARGVEKATVTLHVGPGTFRPVKVEDVGSHVMHEERYELLPAAAATINAARSRGGRVIAVGTTSVRVLETCWDETLRRVVARSGRTRLFLRPPQQPQAVDGLLTNFHLPKSTLLMLVSTFSSVEHVLAAYRLAVAHRLRFYSYGDCMLLL